MSGSQQFNELTEDSGKSEEKCNLNIEGFDSCVESEIMSLQPGISTVEMISK